MFISFQTMVSNGLQGKPGEPVGLPIFAGETPVFHPFCLYGLKIYDRLTKN